jgi:predicted membrane protein
MFFLVAGFALIAQLFGLFVFSINIWWIVLMIFLIAIAVSALVNLNWFLVFVPIAGIVSILNWQTDVITLGNDVYYALFGTAVLLAIGFSILFHKKSYREFRRAHLKRDYEAYLSGEHTEPSDHTDTGKVVHVSAHLGEAVRYIDSKELEKVFIETRMGAAKVYFADAALSNNTADITVDCSLGAIELHVPRSWRIVSGVNAVLGGVSENGHAELTKESPVVNIHGNASLGGIEIYYV